MWNLTPLEWGERLLGKAEGPKKQHPFRPIPDDYVRWLTLFNNSVVAPRLMQYTESYTEFFRVEKDLAIIIPKEEQQEAFYSYKNEFCAPDVPAAFIYFARKIFEQYHIANLIGPLLPAIVSSETKYTNYFGKDYTGVDAICHFVFQEFRPLTPERPIVKCGDWYEIYVPATGMVAAVSPSIGEKLRAEDLDSISFQPGTGLMLGETRLKDIGSTGGEDNGFYDLR